MKTMANQGIKKEIQEQGNGPVNMGITAKLRLRLKVLQTALDQIRVVHLLVPRYLLLSNV